MSSKLRRDKLNTNTNKIHNTNNILDDKYIYYFQDMDYYLVQFKWLLYVQGEAISNVLCMLLSMPL